MEYVKGAAKALYGKDEKPRVAWVRKTATALLRGHVGRVIGGLKQRAEKTIAGSYKWSELRRVIGYFENHREMMTYDRFLAAGYPIATGVIEGACGSLVKNRTDGSGMRWTKKGVQAVLDLRAIKQNGDWEDYCEFSIKQEKQRLYHAA